MIYPDRTLWAHGLNAELNKIDESGAITWLRPSELGIVPNNVNIISLTLTFNYKRNHDGSVEERKSRASVRETK